MKGINQILSQLCQVFLCCFGDLIIHRTDRRNINTGRFCRASQIIMFFVGCIDLNPRGQRLAALYILLCTSARRADAACIIKLRQTL